MFSNQIQAILQDAISVQQAILKDVALLDSISAVSQCMITAFQNGHRVWFCGNGGSASDAQHLAAELSGRFFYDRPPLFAEALHVNTSYLTAVANDYGYDQVFARLLQAKAQKGDILIALSTSGNSPNILKALEMATQLSVTKIGMTGDSGGKMKAHCDYLLNVPSNSTPRIQEGHILIGHIYCQLIEAALFPQGDG